MPLRTITSLVYVSTSRPGLDQDDLLTIMTVSQRNNERAGITGLILFNGFNFMQCIEGERALANECLHRIGLDERHSGMTIISHREIAAPQFAESRMVSPFLASQPQLAKSDLAMLLSNAAVNEATRTLFQSFLSLGNKAIGS